MYGWGAFALPLPWKINNVLGTYCEFVFVALDIQHAVRMRRIVICGLSDSTILFHIMS
jgi:hypothetical protein